MSDVANNGENKGGVTGKGFVPGQSGNPSGRPVMPAHIKEAFEKLTPKAVKVLEDILDGTDKSARAVDKVRAADVVFDRIYGKPVQAVDATVTERRPVVFSARVKALISAPDE